MNPGKDQVRSSKEMPDSVEDFLKKSNEIQEEIRKLSNLCDDSYNKTPNEPSNSSKEEKQWKDINHLLAKHGFANFKGQDPNLNSVCDTLLHVLNELSRVKSIINDLESQVSSLKNIQASLAGGKHRRRPSSIYSSYDSGAERGITSKLKILDEVKALINADSYESIVSDIKKITQVIVTLPNIEKFINCICAELVPDLSTPDYLEIALKKFKKISKVQKEFEFVLQENMGMKKILDYFCKLFDVQGMENVMEAIECVFYFVHEMKDFLEIARRALQLSSKASPSLVIQEIMSKLN